MFLYLMGFIVRETKFKAVIDDNQIMRVLSLNADGSVIVRFGLESGFIPSYRVKAILQYTGLKDKNDKEFYDGDIYRQWGKVCKCDFEQTIYEKMNCLIFEGDFEIIGNIYENPELLKANK